MGFGADHNAGLVSAAEDAAIEQASYDLIEAGNLREQIAAEIAAQIDPEWPNDSVSDAYRHAAMIAAGTWGAGGNA